MKKAKREYFKNVNLHNFTGTKKFWKTVKPAFRIKFKTCSTSSLIEKSTFMIAEKVLAKTLMSNLLTSSQILARLL